MKKTLCAMLIFVFINILPAAAYEFHQISDNLVNETKVLLEVNDDGATLLYEKISITDTYSAWMLGWFWDDYKIVAGVTDSGDIIYYNKASLSDEPEVHGDEMSYEAGYNTAYEFITRLYPDKSLQLIDFDSFTYKFANFVNGIRVYGNDATVVVDKYHGEVFYYQGFGDYECSYSLPKNLIDIDTALTAYYDKIGMELIYETKYDADSRRKTNRLSYILNDPYSRAIDAESGNVHNIKMYDYNYYYNDEYYLASNSLGNGINDSEGSFVPKENISEVSVTNADTKLKNLFYALRYGYSFNYTFGNYSYYTEFENQSTFPAWQIDIYPAHLSNISNKLISYYDAENYDDLSQIETQLEYVFARAYITADGSKLLGFDTVISGEYSPIIPSNFKNSEDVPKRVYEFVQRCGYNEDELRLFSSHPENIYVNRYCFARYVNGVRVTGEGIDLLYNRITKDIRKCTVNMSSKHFSSLDGIKSASQIFENNKNSLSYELFYVDNDKSNKIPVYSFPNKNISFNPFTGARTDLLETSDKITKIFTCSIGSENYTVNGNSDSADAPLAYQGNVYLPVRFFAESLGYELIWNGDSAVMQNQSDRIILDINSHYCTINSVPTTIDKAPRIVNGTTYLSVSSLTKIFGMQSRWNSSDNKIIIVN